ncbi:hypothetical protein RCL_jg6978.t1 [Rhizophagus clarus]|uniref:Uncharacterized protein n=1 Tax=Rhizophagus clarus TaxID=94130 RepID=A0A8H3LF82_9GLOM|nr:hypothetical protein RCL_jg6978.t1 [Rhizophagus clarus]
MNNKQVTKIIQDVWAITQRSSTNIRILIQECNHCTVYKLLTPSDKPTSGYGHHSVIILAISPLLYNNLVQLIDDNKRSPEILGTSSIGRY